jgi:hypothetical protein
MTKTLRNLFLAAAFAFGGSAQAFVANVGVDPGEFSITDSKGGTTFEDSLLFSLTVPSAIVSTAFSNWPVPTAGLRNLTLELFQGSTLIASAGPSSVVVPGGGIPVFTLETLSALVSPGSYRLNLSGDVRPDTGFYNWTLNTVAVPEPEQWALMIAGLALVAGLASRRNRKAA